MWFYVIKLLLLPLILLLPLSLSAQNLTVLTTEEPPLSFEKNGAATGFSTDIVTEIMSRVGIPYSIDVMPWARVYKTGLLSKNTVIFTMARTHSREDLFQWVGPIVRKKWILYRHKNNEMKFNHLLEVKNKSIVVVQNDARAVYLREKGFENIYEVNNNSIALNMLMKGRADLWASSDFEGPVIVKDSGYKMSELKKAHTFNVIESYIGFSKNTPLTIVTQWRDAFAEIKRDGTLDMIAKKWSKLSGLEMTAEKGVISFK